MDKNSELNSTFYSAFKNRDYLAMQNSYADEAVFNDEVFIDLNSQQVKEMWEMLLKKSKYLKLDFKIIKTDDFSGTAEWIATYTFSPTKQKVVNHIYVSIEF